MDNNIINQQNEFNSQPAAGVNQPAQPVVQTVSPQPPVTQGMANPVPPVQPPEPKKKKNKNLIIAILIAIVVIIFAVCLLSGEDGDSNSNGTATSDNQATTASVDKNSDEYKYQTAMGMLASGDYEEAYEILYALGDYNDAASYLPFNGKYVNISVGDKRTITFTDGEYTKFMPSNSYLYGTYTVEGYKEAILVDSDSNYGTECFAIYKNYIYQVKDDNFIFNEKLDISNGFMNATITCECVSTLYMGSLSMTVTAGWKYVFSSDGTYVETVSSSIDGDSTSEMGHSGTVHSGTYEIDGDFITLTDGEDGETKSYLVIDGTVYRIVYVKAD